MDKTPEYRKYLGQAEILYKNCYANDNVGDGKITTTMLIQAQAAALIASALMIEEALNNGKK